MCAEAEFTFYLTFIPDAFYKCRRFLTPCYVVFYSSSKFSSSFFLHNSFSFIQFYTLNSLLLSLANLSRLI